MWTVKGRKKFEEYFGRKNEEGRGGVGRLKKRVKEMVERVERDMKGGEKRGWWDR